MRINETAADLAVLLAALSSFRDRPLPIDLVVFGEVGLAGEIRPVSNGEERLREAAKHGFKQAIVPRANLPRCGWAGGGFGGAWRQPVGRGDGPDLRWVERARGVNDYVVNSCQSVVGEKRLLAPMVLTIEPSPA